jgi:hypothetical protein
VRPFDPGSRARLSPYDLGRFPGDTLFDRVARAVCAADVLPRKELYESWEVARRAKKLAPGGRVVDLAAGHGLVALLSLLLDPSRPRALAVDVRCPESHAPLARALEAAWPRLAGRLEYRTQSLDAPLALDAGDLIVSAHGCGALTDQVLTRAMGARAAVAVLPCCQALKLQDMGGLEGWLEPTLAVDVTRAARLRAGGYRVKTQHIPGEITEKNRLLLGWLPDACAVSSD